MAKAKFAKESLDEAQARHREQSKLLMVDGSGELALWEAKKELEEEEQKLVTYKEARIGLSGGL